MCVGADVTGFTCTKSTNANACTNGTVCAGDTVECICSTSSGVIVWNIISNQAPEVKETIHSHNCNAVNGSYTFTCNKSLNTSQLSFKLSHSETVHIKCSNGNEMDNRITTITDAG